MIAVFGFAAWVVFCVRDYWLLETFAGRKKKYVIFSYLASIVGTAAFLGVSGKLLARFEEILISTGVVIAAVAAHLVASVWSFRLDRLAALSAAWKLVLFPAPAAWILLVLAVASVRTAPGVGAARIAAWIAVASGLVVATAAWRFGAEPGTTDDLAFRVRFATCSNCLALCLLPLIAV